MATHRAGALVVGVSAGGVPGAAARIRDAIAARFDARYAARSARLGDAPPRAARSRATARRGARSSPRLIDDDFCDAVEQGALDERVAAWR